MNKEIITETSISDSSLYSDYPSLCATAAVNWNVFNEFRTYKEIIEVLDHVTIDQATTYINEILRNSNWEQEFTDTLIHTDSLGNLVYINLNMGLFLRHL